MYRRPFVVADGHAEMPHISESSQIEQSVYNSEGQHQSTGMQKNLIVRIGKSEAKASSNRRLRSRYSTV